MSDNKKTNEPLSSKGYSTESIEGFTAILKPRPSQQQQQQQQQQSSKKDERK
ncbi:hypothetical protein [Photobacterium kishitanii]|uniref:hypothetical protein n=1 Tax=Photobacterium kishitanii TaxID=318456 RepID=UPI0015E64BE9|nr:hypothetical protein [Photobacterium kishitanii]